MSFFEFGSIYTAISRVKNITDLWILTDEKNKDMTFEIDMSNIYCI